MSQARGPFPLYPTAPFLEGGGMFTVVSTTKPLYLKSGLTYGCRTSTGAISLILPPNGYVNIVDVDGTAASNNITITAPPTHTILDGAVGDTFVIDVAFFGVLIFKVPTRLNWSVS